MSLFKDAVEDYRITLKILRANWKPFLSTEIFALFSATILILTLDLGFNGLSGLFSPVPLPIHINSPNFIKLLIILLIFYTFLTAQFGLAHDIILSGDMFSEFRSSFYYFKKHWFSYIILTVLTGWGYVFINYSTIYPILDSLKGSNIKITNPGLNTPSNLVRPDIILNNLNYLTSIYLFSILIQFLFFFLFISAIPSITHQENLKKAILESLKIVKRNSSRLLIVLGTFFIVFDLSPIIFDFFILFFNFSNFIVELNYVRLFYHFIIILISSPILALLSTRLYNILLLSKNELEFPSNDTIKNQEPR